MSDLPEKGWKGYGGDQHPYTDPYRELRQHLVSRVRGDLRAVRLDIDNKNHEFREAHFKAWLAAHTYVFHDVAGRLYDIADRREWRR